MMAAFILEGKAVELNSNKRREEPKAPPSQPNQLEVNGNLN
jgi:hypothetical protein